MSEPGLIGLNDYQDSSRCCGEKSRSSDNPVNPGSDKKIPCRLTIYILFLFIYCVIGGIMLVPQSHPPLVPEGEKFENLSALLKNISKQGPILTIAFSPDGKTLASGSYCFPPFFEDNMISIWDVVTGREIRRLEGHTDSVTYVRFSPDGKILASGSFDNTIRLWDAVTGGPIKTLTGHTGPVLSVIFSPDGKTLASGSVDNTIRLWNVVTGDPIKTLTGHTGPVLSVSFSLDGKTLASSSPADNTIRLWNIVTGNPIKTLEGHSDGVNTVIFSPDGKTLASGAEDYTIRLWNVVTGNPIKTLEGHSDGVNTVIFSPDGKTLASGSFESTIRLWDVVTGNPIKMLTKLTFPVTTLSFNPDGKTLASGSMDSIRLWDTVTGNPIKTLRKHTILVASMSISPDGKILASVSWGSTIRLWDVLTGNLIRTLMERTMIVNTVIFSPDGKTLASGAEDNTIRLWNVATGNPIKTLTGHTGQVLDVIFSPDGKTLASGSTDNTIRLWDAVTGNPIKTLQVHTSIVYSVSFSPDGKTLASGSSDKTIRLWNVGTGTLIKALTGHTNSVSTVCFSPDGKTLASGSDDNTIRLWNAGNGTLIKELRGHRDSINDVSFSPDGKTLASGSSDKTIRLWNVGTGTFIKALTGHTNSVNTVCFSPDKKAIASCSLDGTLQLRKLVGSQWILAKIFIAGSQGNWLSIDTIENRVMRGDDGTLLVTFDKSGLIKPVPPPIPQQKGTLEVITHPGHLQTFDGQATPFPLELRNSGPGKIYWIRVIKDCDREPTHTDPLVFHPPKTYIVLEPGETASLPCKVSTLSKYTNPTGQNAVLYLKITSKYNSTKKPILLDIPVTVNIPTLHLLEAKVQKQDKTLSLVAKFQNIGAQNLPADIHFSGKVNDNTLDEIKHPEIIQPGATKDILFVIPASLAIDKNTRFKLIARKTSFPVHEWEFKFKDIPVTYQPTLWYLYVLGGMIFLGILASLYYLRYFHHPLVLSLSKKPVRLIRLLPGQLTQAGRLFFPAPRLETLLSSAGVSRERYNKALAFYHDLGYTPARQCQYLAQRLEATMEPVFEKKIYIYKLRMSPGFILNMDRCLLVIPPQDMEETEILSHIKKIEDSSSQVCLVIFPYEGLQSGLYLTAKKFDNWLVVPGLPMLTELLLSPTPLDVFARLVSSQIKVTRISPYQTGGGVNKEAIFFGREQLLAHILQREPANYLLVGGRQLGKSSLLKAIERRYIKDPSMECYYLTLSKEEIASHLAGALDLPADTSLDQVLQTMSQGPKRLFLIDEADKFIAAEAQTGYTTLQHFRSLSEGNKCYFIFAGFWDLYHTVTFDYRSPLKNFGETLFIEALEAEACWELATKPMALLNIHYQSAELVETLVHETGRRANLVAITCSDILEKLDMTVRLIRREHLDAAFDRVVYSALGGWEELTPDQESNRLDRIIVYSTIVKETFTLPGLIKILEKLGCAYEPEQVKQSLARLELAFILKREKKTYSYRVPLFKKMVRDQDPGVLLSGELKKASGGQGGAF